MANKIFIMEMKEKAQKLVREKIPGTRKGSNEPACEHSIRVGERLEQHGYPEDTVIAGILHDVLEDGGVLVSELREMGFSDRTIALVEHASHDPTIKGSDARWIVMMADIVKDGDADAWAIKTADIMDNLETCHTMRPQRRMFLRMTKGPLFLSLVKERIKSELEEEFHKVLQKGMEEEGIKWQGL